MLGWDESIKKELGACGQNVMIGHNVLFARPEKVFLGDNVRIDPFTLVVCGLEAEGNNQISSHAIMNGRQTVKLGKWVGFGYRTTILTGSEDFTGEFGPANDHFGHNISTEGDVVFEDYSNALTNSLIMPGVTIPEGAVIAAYATATQRNSLMPYWIYGMQPSVSETPAGVLHRYPHMTLTALKERNKENILSFARKWENVKQFRLSE